MSSIIGKIERLSGVPFLLEALRPRVLGIIQARSTSKRLPGKIFMKIGDKTILEHCASRCLESKVDKWVCAVPYKEVEFELWPGNVEVRNPKVKENDVLGRFARVAEEFPEYEWIVRITADSPFVNPKIIDETIEHATKTNRPQFDYFNEGSCVAVFRREDLLKADKLIKGKMREHVCEGFRKGFPDDKGSIDTASDLKKARRKYELLRK